MQSFKFLRAVVISGIGGFKCYGTVGLNIAVHAMSVYRSRIVSGKLQVDIQGASSEYHLKTMETKGEQTIPSSPFRPVLHSSPG